MWTKCLLIASLWMVGCAWLQHGAGRSRLQLRPLVSRLEREKLVSRRLSVGDTVIGEVQDIGGSAANPQIFFKIAHGSEEVAARMPAQFLNPAQRMAIRPGSKLKVQIARTDQQGLVLRLATGGQVFTPSPPKPASEARENPSAMGLSLSDLRVGMPLNGTVVHCTNYAGFLDVGVVRVARNQGLAPVQAMLHKSDIDPNLLRKMQRSKSRLSNQLLPLGITIPVYVKEVYKNNGKLTVSTDDTIDKKKVMQALAERKERARSRKQTRRLFEQLAAFQVGQHVSGRVARVVKEGVLVEVDHSGSFPITALLGTRDLPPQFKVPDDLSPEHAQQLLEMDFQAGRSLQGTVLKISDFPTPSLPYHMKILLEELGPHVEDDDQVDDQTVRGESIRRRTGSSASSQESHEEIAEIFHELQGSRGALEVADILGWEEVKEMLETKQLDQEQIHQALRSAGVDPSSSANAVSFPQFISIVESLQDTLASLAYDENEEDDAEINAELAKALAEAEDDEENDDSGMEFDEGTEVAEKEEDIVERKGQAVSQRSAPQSPILRTFESMRNSAGVVTVGAVKRHCPEARALIENRVVSEIALEAILQSALDIRGQMPASTPVSFPQYVEIVEALDEVDRAKPSRSDSHSSSSLSTADSTAERKETAFVSIGRSAGKTERLTVKSFLQGEEVQSAVQAGSVSELTVRQWIEELIGKKRSNAVLSPEQYMQLTERLSAKSQSDRRSTSDGSSSESKSFEESEEESMEDEHFWRQDYESLRDENGIVTPTTIRTWLRNLVDEEEISPEEVDDLLQSITQERQEVSFDEFMQIANTLQDTLDEEGDDDLADIFESISSEGKVTVEAFRECESLQEMLNSGLVSRVDVESVLAKTLGPQVDATSAISFDQFVEIVYQLEDLADQRSEDISFTQKDSSMREKEEEEEEEEDQEAEMMDLEAEFASLQDGKGVVTIRAFKGWELVKQLLEDEVISAVEMNAMLEEVVGKKAAGKTASPIAWTQFETLVDWLHDKLRDYYTAEEEEALPDDEALFRELLPKGQEKLSVEDFLRWEEFQLLFESGALSQEGVRRVLQKLQLGSGPGLESTMDFAKFQQVLHGLDDLVDPNLLPKESSEEELKIADGDTAGKREPRPQQSVEKRKQGEARSKH